MIHVKEPWQIHTLKNYRVYVLENPWFSAVVKSPSKQNLEHNSSCLIALCRGAAYITHDYGSETISPGLEPKELWPGDYSVSISNDARYCCVNSISEDSVNLELGIVNEPRVFRAWQTVLLLDGKVSVNGYIYDQVTQIDLKEDKTFNTEYAVLAWTVI